MPKLEYLKKFPLALIVDILNKSNEFKVAGYNNRIFFKTTEELKDFTDIVRYIQSRDKYQNCEALLKYLSEKDMIKDNWDTWATQAKSVFQCDEE